MNRVGRYQGTWRYVAANWPAYLLTYGAIVLALIFIGISARRGWLSFIPLALALFLILSYFLLASLWSAHQQFDPGGVRPHDVLFDMAQLSATDTFVYIGLGLRAGAVALSRRLTTGEIIVIDVYNPQWTTSHALSRGRAQAKLPPPDPRLSWRVGSIELLPLPDESMPAVILCQVASEFWQHGDRLMLLKEIHRILRPNGRLLLAERVRSQTNWLVLGPAALALPPADYWRTLLLKAGFEVRREQHLADIIACFRADKPVPSRAQQLALELDFIGD